MEKSCDYKQAFTVIEKFILLIIDNFIDNKLVNFNIYIGKFL